MTTLDLSKAITSAVVAKDKSSVTLTWSDGHVGTFNEDWLVRRSFSQANQYVRLKGFRDDPKIVGSRHQIRRLNFQEVLENDQQLFHCLNEVSRVGVVILEDALREPGQLKLLANRIGFMRTTHYGNEFTVRSVPDAVNLAYTSAPLNLHTDLPYYAYPPGVQALHCIKQSNGQRGENLAGESLLVDGFIVASHMKREMKEEYDALCNILVEFQDVGEDYTKFNKIHHSPTFVTCPCTGELSRIVFNNQQLSSYLPTDVEKVHVLYRALKAFNDLCYHENYQLKYKLTEGEIILFDNWRWLHGRTGFDPSARERHLEGCYFDWDEIFSRMRVIQANQAQNSN